MRKIYLGISMLLVFLLFIGCGKIDKKVVVIEKTRIYHAQKCSKVNMAKTEEMTETLAREKKYSPCSLCKPDQRND